MLYIYGIAKRFSVLYILHSHFIDILKVFIDKEPPGNNVLQEIKLSI